ncbi:MAG: hypothetical protein JSR78_09580 [Proteobacteria bacterium]|nr:hypothetical protein [Pseudomonadota bacterium]
MTVADGRPSLLYVAANWCLTGAVIDRTVLSNSAVRAVLARLNLIKLDASNNFTAERQLMQSL